MPKNRYEPTDTKWLYRDPTGSQKVDPGWVVEPRIEDATGKDRCKTWRFSDWKHGSKEQARQDAEAKVREIERKRNDEQWINNLFHKDEFTRPLMGRFDGGPHSPGLDT